MASYTAFPSIFATPCVARHNHSTRPSRPPPPPPAQALLVLPVAEGVCARYAALAEELLVSVRKTESSLKRLKKAKAGGEEGACGAGGGWVGG